MISQTKLLSFIKPTTVLAAALVIALAITLGYGATRMHPIVILGLVASVGVLLLVIEAPWYGFLFLVFFLPFERIGSYDIGGVTIRPSQVITLCTLFALFLAYASRRRLHIPSYPILLPVCGFIIVSLFGLLNAPNIERSILVFCFILFTASLSFIVPMSLYEHKQIKTLVKVLAVSFVIVCVFGIFQFIGDWIGLPSSITGLRSLYTKEVLGFPRVQSTALEPLYFANYLLLPLSIFLSLFFARTTFFKLPTQLFLLGIGWLNLLLTVARGGYIAFACSAMVLLIYYFSKIWTLRNVIIATIGIVVITIGALQLTNLQTVTENFVTHVTNLFTGASYSERVETFTIAVKAFETHPLVGIGPGSFGPYAAAHPYIVPSQGWKIVNNEYLELLAEHGILGLSLMVLIWVIVLVRSVKAMLRAQDPFLKAILAGTIAAFIGILVQYNTFSILYITHIWFTVGLLIALQNMSLQSSKK